MSASDPAREWRAYSFRTAAVGAGGLGTLLKGNSSPKAVGAPQGLADMEAGEDTPVLDG